MIIRNSHIRKPILFVFSTVSNLFRMTLSCVLANKRTYYPWLQHPLCSLHYDSPLAQSASYVNTILKSSESSEAFPYTCWFDLVRLTGISFTTGLPV